ncbi:hypothetical protein ACLMJK_003943 [Lecanora helva]
MALATATLASSYVYAYKFGIPYNIYSSNMENPYLYNDNKYNGMNASSTTCEIKGSVGYTLYPLCGTRNLANNSISSGIFTNAWMWLVWASCILWLPICALKHWQSRKTMYSKPRSWSLDSISKKYTWVRRVSKEIGTCRAWSLISCITWSLCFGCQFYLFSVYFGHSVISQQWSFGQIIAVTVWVPSVIEYIYIEYNGVVEASKYRYPPPLRLTEAAEASSETLVNPESMDDRKCIDDAQFELARMDSDMSYMSAYREQGL